MATTWGVYFCIDRRDLAVAAANYSPVQLGIQNRTDACRIARSFAILRPDLLWAAIDDEFDYADYAPRGSMETALS